jgi:steroid delta-isomerase-like uncharacterized protein
MANQQNEAVVRRNYEAWSGDMSAIDETVAEDAVSHDPAMPEDVRGPEGAKQAVSMYRQAFPDLKIEVVDIMSDGDKVVTRWQGSGTNDGEMMGMPATGKSTSVEGIAIDVVRDGKIVENWTHWDNLGLMQQLGLAGEPAGAAAG